jgi:DNA-binding MarR family transcriptional regulator
VNAPSAPPPGPDAASADPPLSIAYRLILHIARQGRYGPDEVAPKGLSQAGMVEALGVTQGALVGFLQQFVAAGFLTVQREHVRGVDRRVKVYRLTPQGEAFVQEIRRRQAASTASARTPWAIYPAPEDR